MSASLLVDTPRRATGHRFRIKGYRLGLGRRYKALEPDEEGGILSETTGLRFGVSQDGRKIEIFDSAGKRLLTSEEAREQAAREAEARKAAETELARLRAEIERLKKQE
ncbi:MAG: hypothetical protein ACJ76Y_13090 [Thermoanaerobaculia bacterium]